MKSTPLITALLLPMLIACQAQEPQSKQIAQPQQTQTPVQVKTTEKTITASDLKLDTEQSLLNYVSTKNKIIAENNSLKFSQGSVDQNGIAKLILDLNSLDTNIPIRDQRSKKLMFETEQYPTAEITGQLPKELPLDQPVNININIKLHGMEKSYRAAIIANLVNQQVSISSRQPIVVNAKDFNLDGGVNQMLKIAKLKSIDHQVPVDFKLIFNQSQ